MLVPDIIIQFKLDGVEKKLSFKDLPLSWWSDIKRQTGFVPKTFLEGLGVFDVDALVTLIWLVRRESKPALTFTMVRDRATSAIELEIVDIVKDGESMFALLDEDEEPKAEEPEEDAPPTNGAS